MQKVLGVINAVFLLHGGVLDTVDAVALTRRWSWGGSFLNAHCSSPVISSPPCISETGGITVEEEDDLLKAGLELGVDESVYDGIDCGVAEEEPVKGYLKGGVDLGRFIVCPDVEENVQSTAPDRQNANQQADDNRQNGHCCSNLLSVYSTLQ